MGKQVNKFTASKNKALGTVAVVEPQGFSMMCAYAQGEYEAYQVLTKETDIASYFRTQMVEGGVPDFSLDDNQIVAIVKSIPYVATEGESQGSSDWEIAVCETLQSRNRGNEAPITAPLPDTRSSIDIRASTGSIAGLEAERMDKDETFRKDMHDVALAPTVTKRGGLTALLNVLRLSGYTIKQATEGTLDSYGFTKDDKDNVTFNGYIDTHFPNPDTKPRNSKGEIDKNYRVKRDEWNKYAQHYRMVGTEKQLYDWYVEFISRTAEGKADIQYLNDLDNGMPKKKGERTGPYKAASKAWLQDQKAMYNARFNAKVTAIKKGISAYYQMQDIMLRLPKVGCGFEQIRDPENKEAFIVTNGVQPMIIWDNESRGVKESYSVSAFNNLDVSKALAAGGTFSDLMESTARGAKELGAGESLDWTQETWRWRLPDMVRATSDSHFTAELLKATAERDPKSRQYTADADDAFILMYELVRSLLPFYSAQGKAERYIEVTNARNAAQQKELNQRDPEAAGVRK